MIGPVPMCYECDHVHLGSSPFSCDAFPEGIPEDIYMGGFDHRDPYPSSKNPMDNGIRFEPIKEQ